MRKTILFFEKILQDLRTNYIFLYFLYIFLYIFLAFISWKIFTSEVYLIADKLSTLIFVRCALCITMISEISDVLWRSDARNEQYASSYIGRLFIPWVIRGGYLGQDMYVRSDIARMSCVSKEFPSKKETEQVFVFIYTGSQHSIK